MYQAEYKGINSFLRDACRLLLKEGICRETRGMKCYELPEPVMFKISDPTARLVTIAERNWYAPLSYGESLWLAAGRNDMEYIRQFGIRKFPKKLVISLLFCNFMVENQ